MENVNNWCDINLDIDHLFPDKKNENLITSFEKIVTADLTKLLSIRDYIDTNKIKMTDGLKNYLLKTVYQCNIDRLAFVRNLGTLREE
ncbi:hypothetical protein AMQ84_26095 [Paenibacillus riograndensis]|uniref:Uncharacterized protein n=1 Tax=Paenibacillus riograndensis TaxID=483937 RepID=A0A132TLB9_9BACL|nr:hypothetical protein [Paenibacillus riograndensis]KWX72157.1 hypothetical protein AMQ84_26095 [Paenibacillus riograndensis]